ncbi:MAG: response regulator [Candidatus Omnitrophota bacterium]
MDKTYTLLCIDDEENILHLFKRIFEKEYNIFTAANGAEGLDILRRKKIDLILCDQRMAGMNGFEVLRIAKKEFPDTMRIMVSGYSDFDSLVKTINEGEIFRFISKPWDALELKNIIKEALEQKDIVGKIKASFNNIQNITQLVKDISVELSQDQSTVFVKLSSLQQSLDTQNITQVLEFLFKMLGLENDKGFRIISNSVIKEKDFVKLEISLAKGVKLIVEIAAKELNN